MIAILFVFAASCRRSEAPAAQQGTTKTMARSRSIRVVVIGDSLAYGIGDESGRGLAMRLKDQLEKQGFAEAKIVNLGVSGAQTVDLIARLEQGRIREALAGADAIVLSIGANDLFRTPAGRAETLRAPLLVAERILAASARSSPSFIASRRARASSSSAATSRSPIVPRLRSSRTTSRSGTPDSPRTSRGGTAYEKMAERIAGMLAKESKAA